MKDKDTPLRLVRLWAKMYPGVYDELDNCRAAKDTGLMSWPDYCELPISAAFTYLTVVQALDKAQASEAAAELTACWTWRRSKKVFAFDSDLAEALAAQAEDVQDTDVLPAELLLHLPYPCIYVKAPTLLEQIDGFFVWDEYNTESGLAELRVQWVAEDMSTSFPQVIHLLPGSTLKECISDTIRETREDIINGLDLDNVGAGDTRIIISAIQLVLYLISDSAELDPVPRAVPRDQARSSAASRDKDKASMVDEVKVGVRIGAALRKAKCSYTVRSRAEGKGAPRRSHTRRGHWHHFWTGPLDADRKLVLKWVAPTVIHPETDEEDNVVIYPVKGPKPRQ